MTPSVLAIAHARSVTAVRSRVSAMLVRTWTGLPDHWDVSASDFIGQFTPILIGGEATIATLTQAYLTELISQQTGERVALPSIPAEMVTGASLRNGVAPDVEWLRPFKTVWYELSQGSDLATATRAGLVRAQSMAAVDLQLAQTHGARATFGSLPSKTRVVGYRRVLTSGHSCDLCSIAATQRYHTEDLMPIHNRCSCTVEPIYGDKPIGQVIEAKDASDLAVREHGEIGPVLTVRAQDFRGPSDVASDVATATETVAA